MELVINALLGLLVVATAIMAGVYFCFSAFVVRSLDAIGLPAGMAAMQSINRLIVRSAFLPLFFASTALCAMVFVVGWLDRQHAGAWPLLMGSGLYVAGMFAVTVLRNVPLNNALDAASAQGDEARENWRRYMRAWLAWNHVRTVSCILSSTCLLVALVQRAQAA
ncbi:DUF1772 domain-containing protein [Novosphingobium sp. YJ-S2-02]|uniref:DUF1772 domain-containing protein n=2 Tax=Novosphingobium aureum TaxID=2792964 RepID=A0A931HBR6_9SPHN|nr:DUF1772 domain-containing protein [Novosphingobium aureum]